MPTIWGTDPKGNKNKVFAIHIPKGDVEEITANGEREGWSDLTTIWNPESRLLGQSESSASESSPETKPSSSETSVATSPASATRSRPSRKRGSRKRL